MPHTPDIAAVFGIRECRTNRQLIALLPVLAAALAVGLSDDGAVATVRPFDAAGRQH